jgi:p-aminobenzoyl-glutamate transporter AbgT
MNILLGITSIPLATKLLHKQEANASFAPKQSILVLFLFSLFAFSVNFYGKNTKVYSTQTSL